MTTRWTFTSKNSGAVLATVTGDEALAGRYALAFLAQDRHVALKLTDVDGPKSSGAYYEWLKSLSDGALALRGYRRIDGQLVYANAGDAAP